MVSQLPELKVTSHRAVFLYKGKDVDPREVGQQLGVEAVRSRNVEHEYTRRLLLATQGYTRESATRLEREPGG